jgi:outer membrane biosynthesis protein TonB
MDRADAAGFGVSVVGHSALLAIAWFFVTRPVELPTEPPSFEVSYVDEVGLTAASPNPAPSAMASVAPEVAPPEEAAPAPAPAPVPEPTPAPARAAPRPAPSPDRAAPPARSDPPRATRQQGSATAQRNTGSLLGPNLLRGIGNDRNVRSNSPPAATYGASERASVRQAIARALMRCQRQPLPAPEAAAIRVDYRITLNPDGSLANAQFVQVLNDDPSLERYERRMKDIALNVINACTPIRGLPAEFYDVPGGWRQFPYRFNPRTVQ